MRPLFIVIAFAFGCQQESGFQQNPDDNAVAEGEATMEVDPTELVWTDVPVGSARSQSIFVTNIGDNELHLRYGRVVDDEANAFYTDEDANEDRKLNPDESWEIIVVCDLNEAAEAVGTFRLSSNDKDRAVLDIPLTCTPEGDAGA